MELGLEEMEVDGNGMDGDAVDLEVGEAIGLGVKKRDFGIGNWQCFNK